MLAWSGGISVLLLHDRAGTNNIVNLQTEREEKQIGLAGSAMEDPLPVGWLHSC